MSAPIAVWATAGATILLLTLSIANSFVGCGTCGYVGEGEHFPAFRAGSGSRESGAGRQRRSSTYPQAFLVNLARRVVAEALVLALLVVEAEPGANAGLRLGDTGIGVQIDLFIFQAAPQPLDEDVVHAAALAVHADRDTAILEHAGELGAGKLAALIGVEDLGLAVPCQSLFEGLDAEIGAERVRQLPRQHRTAVPVHDRDQVQEAFG